MNEVWFIIHFVEFGLGCLCIYYHVSTIQLEDEMSEHRIIFCGTFFGLTAMTLAGNLAACAFSPPSLILETICGFLGFVCYGVTCFLSMYLCEQDIHLSYMSDLEEESHLFFKITQKQGLACLYSACAFLVHGVFAFEALIYSRHRDPSSLEEGKLELNVMLKPWIPLLENKCFIRRMFFQHPTARRTSDMM